jgi:hypothetical protein
MKKTLFRIRKSFTLQRMSGGNGGVNKPYSSLSIGHRQGGLIRRIYVNKKQGKEYRN